MSTVLTRTLPRCRLISTGGTIAMKIDPVRQAPVPAVSGVDLLRSVAGLAEVAEIEVEDLCNVPSGYMDQQCWVALHRAVAAALARDEVHGVVISHGTDTLEETGWFLDLTLPGPKPVVLVGAQRNASDPNFEGARNLLDAARVCVSPGAQGKGVLLVLNNQINAAREGTKTHTSDVESFKSGTFGFLGTVDEDRVVFSRAPLRRQHIELGSTPLPRVDIVTMYGGADGTQVRAAVAAGARGIIVQGLGLGNVNEAMYESIIEAIDAGVTVVVSTRVPQGRVRPVYGFPGGGVTLKERGALFADDLSPHKARILLMLALQVPRPAAEIQSMFDR